MKTLNFLTTGAAAAMLLLGSCTKDVDNLQGGGRGDGVVVEGLPTYATVSLSQRSGAGTYALNDTDYVGGNSDATEAEKKIESAAVLVFNENDVLENYVKFDAADIAKDPKAKTFATTTGKKRLFAVANLPEESYNKLQGIFEGKTAADKQLGNICKVIQQITDILNAATDNKFYMSSVYPLNQTTEPQVTVLNVNKGDVEAGNDEAKNNFKIFIGRMTGKVSLSFDNALVIKSNDGAFDKDNATYRVRNNPKRFYTFPVYEGTQLISPYYNRTYDLPNPTDYADANTSVGKNDFFDNGHDAAAQPNHVFVATNVDSYLTENSPKEAKRHKVTFLSIKAKWTPDENALLLKADGSVAADKAAEITKITGANQGTFYRVQEWKDGKIVGYCPGIYAETPTNWTAVGGTPDANPGALTAKAADRDAAKQNNGYLIVTYTNGTAYWAYWMKSSNNGAIAEKYALKRNNHYKVNIISVDGVGEPTEDDNLDKEEDIEADTYMKATIEVLKWNEVNIEGGI